MPFGITYKLSLFLFFAVSVATLGVAGSLVKTFGSQFPNGYFGSRTRLITFSATWNTLFSLMLFISLLAAPKTLGASLLANFVPIFVGFLISLVGAASFTQQMVLFNCDEFPYDKCSMFRGLQGMSWVMAWINLLVLVLIIVAYFKREEAEEAEDKGKEVQV